MNDNYLIEKVERDCPLCDKVHFVEKRKRVGEMLIKNEVTNYEEVYFFCPESVDYEEDEFVSADLMDQNLLVLKMHIEKIMDFLHLMRLQKFEDYME